MSIETETLNQTKNEMEKAIAFYEKAIQIRPDSADAYKQLASGDEVTSPVHPNNKIPRINMVEIFFIAQILIK